MPNNTANLTLVKSSTNPEREEWMREIAAAAHRWQVTRMTEELAKPLRGNKVTPGDDVHRLICAIQIIRNQVPQISMNALAEKAGIPRSTLRDRLNGRGILTVVDFFNIANAMGVPFSDVFDLSAKGTQ